MIGGADEGGALEAASHGALRVAGNPPATSGSVDAGRFTNRPYFHSACWRASLPYVEAREILSSSKLENTRSVQARIHPLISAAGTSVIM